MVGDWVDSISVHVVRSLKNIDTLQSSGMRYIYIYFVSHLTQIIILWLRDRVGWKYIRWLKIKPIICGA